MTDDELAAIRVRRTLDDGDERVRYDRDNLLAYVHNLRAELAGRRAGEPELARVFAEAAHLRQYPSLRDNPIVAAAHHITWQENAMCDLLNNEGRALREQGAAEERALVAAMIRRDADNWEPNGSIGGELGRLATYIERTPTLPDLLPPLESRALLDAERRKVATLRAACGRIADSDWCPVSLGDVALKALEETKDA